MQGIVHGGFIAVVGGGRSLHRTCMSALILAVLSVPAFGQAAGAAGTPNAAVAGAAEAAQVQAFLDARYKASDVRYSFHTKAGQDIDCVDFFAEPGVKALVARGQNFTAIPKPPQLPEAYKNRAPVAGLGVKEDLSFHGQPDANGKAEQCPEGTVPEVRITAGDIARAGGLSTFMRLQKKGPPRVHGDTPSPFSCAMAQSKEYPTYGHVVGTLFYDTPGIVYGSTVMSIYGPKVPNVYGDHSLSQLWLYAGSNTVVEGGACTSDCVQSIEIGWDVDGILNPGDTHTPHLFMFSTNDGYANGCYNNVPGAPGACVPWVPLPGAAFALNQAFSFDPPGNTGGAHPAPPPIELTETVILIGDAYWITLQVGSTSSYIGYFPKSDFAAPMDTFQVGGEIDDQTGAFGSGGPQMGSGFGPASGYGWAAYHHDFASAWFDTSLHWSSGAAMCATRPTYYSETTTGGLPSWNQSFFYGGPPTRRHR